MPAGPARQLAGKANSSRPLFKTSLDDDWKTKHINTEAPDRFAFFIDNETSECHAFHLRDMEPTLAGAPANAYDMLDVHWIQIR